VATGLTWFGAYLTLLFLVAAVAIRRLDHAVFTGWGKTT